MPIDIDGQTIWVECVESQKGSGDAIMMEVGDTEGIFLFCFFTFFFSRIANLTGKIVRRKKLFPHKISFYYKCFCIFEFCRILSQFNELKGLILS